MIKLGSGFRLSIESLHVGLVGQLSRQDHLQGDDSLKVYLPRLEDHPHPATGDLLQQLIITEVADPIPVRWFSLISAEIGCRTENCGRFMDRRYGGIRGWHRFVHLCENLPIRGSTGPTSLPLE